MAEELEDVKATAESSTAEGVKEAVESPPAGDVKSESSTEKKHEEQVPYERLKEKVDEVEVLRARLVEFEAKDEDIDPYAGLLNEETTTPQVTDMADAETKFREALEDNPMQTMTQFMNQYFYNLKQQDKKNEQQVRNIPGFDDLEKDYRRVPDEFVIKAQQNPEMIRLLLARHEQAVKGGKAATQKAAVITAPQTVEELAEKYRKEGEQSLLARMKAGESIIAESGNSGAAATSEDTPELDDYQKSLAKSLGLSEKDFAPMAKRAETLEKRQNS